MKRTPQSQSPLNDSLRTMSNDPSQGLEQDEPGDDEDLAQALILRGTKLRPRLGQTPVSGDSAALPLPYTGLTRPTLHALVKWPLQWPETMPACEGDVSALHPPPTPVGRWARGGPLAAALGAWPAGTIRVRQPPLLAARPRLTAAPLARVRLQQPLVSAQPLALFFRQS